MACNIRQMQMLTNTRTAQNALTALDVQMAPADGASFRGRLTASKLKVGCQKP